MSSDINPGDVVTLKSGGQAMTVENVVTSTVPGHVNVASLIWLDEAGVMQRVGGVAVTLLVKKETVP